MRRHPFIYEINTWVWLDALSRREGAAITLAGVPGREWDAMAELGFDAVWLMGVWERSPAGIAIALENDGLVESFRRALPDFVTEDVVGSPYCIRDYRVDAHLGGPEGLAAARAALAERGLGLILDFVPNHVAPDHPWTDAHPEYFVARQRRRPRARSGVVRARRRPRPGERSRSVLPGLAGRRPAERLLARPAGRGRGDARLDRRAVRRRPLRHGDADDERHLRADLGRPRRAATGRRLLAERDPGGQERPSRVRLRGRGLLGPRMGAPATGLRLLLRQAALRPPCRRPGRGRARAPHGRASPTSSGSFASSRTTTSLVRRRPSRASRRGPPP